MGSTKNRRIVACPQCGVTFETSHSQKRFCSPDCRLRWHGSPIRLNAAEQQALKDAIAAEGVLKRLLERG